MTSLLDVLFSVVSVGNKPQFVWSNHVTIKIIDCFMLHFNCYRYLEILLMSVVLRRQ